MRELGTGHREAVYHKALSRSLSEKGIAHRMEVVTPIMFMGECVGIGRADIVMEGVVIEIKANAKRPAAASGQLRKYMESLNTVENKQCTGVVINFNQATGKVDGISERFEKKQPKQVQSRFFRPKASKSRARGT
jgi:GxxExxY protein